MEKKFRLVMFAENWALDLPDLTFEDAVAMSTGFMDTMEYKNSFLGFLGADPAERKEWVRQISKEDRDLAVEGDE